MIHRDFSLFPFLLGSVPYFTEGADYSANGFNTNLSIYT
jgi:hypothetical protein